MLFILLSKLLEQQKLEQFHNIIFHLSLTAFDLFKVFYFTNLYPSLIHLIILCPRVRVYKLLHLQQKFSEKMPNVTVALAGLQIMYIQKGIGMVFFDRCSWSAMQFLKSLFSPQRYSLLWCVVHRANSKTMYAIYCTQKNIYCIW